MRHKRQGPTWWNAWVPLMLLGGLFVLEHQAPLSPSGHQIAEIALALLMYGLVICWLRCNRGALVHQEYEHEQQQERAYRVRQQRREPAISDHESWDDAWLSWQSDEHDTDIQRRR